MALDLHPTIPMPTLDHVSRRARTRLTSGAAFALAAALLFTGCGGDDPVRPPSAVGSYEATTFTATEGATTTDVLAEGGYIDIVLTGNGLTTGHLFVPASVTGDVDQDDDLAGSWGQSGATVTLVHPADTFLRDMPFTVQGNTLVGDRTFGTTRIRVTLTRTQ